MVRFDSGREPLGPRDPGLGLVGVVDHADPAERRQQARQPLELGLDRKLEEDAGRVGRRPRSSSAERIIPATMGVAR